MTETPAVEPEEADESDDLLPYEHADNELRRLVSVTNETKGFEPDITLHLGGSLVSGRLISVKAYAEGTAALLRAADPESPVNDGVAKYFDEWVDLSDPDVEEGPDEWINTRCVHLRDVTFHGPTGQQQGWRTPLWRGRLSAVAGWSFGNWTPS